ncbi:MAG: polysaccharide biosynthesis/export family protein [Saprospiraceae bacterium]|nr:polysaccharide biosynthesis/export family protein [Saprospiraceae bacterium]
MLLISLQQLLFNLGPIDYNWTFGNLESLQLNGYLVDPKGDIDFPILGSINLNGLTTVEAKESIAKLLTSYLRDPVVNIRFLNFKITVSGEVANPGTFTVVNERITLPEAISRAGDLTNYADRRNILIIREIDGVRTFNRINLQSSSIFDSDYYYLRQNDLVYIEPLKAKTGAIGDQTNETASFVVGSATLIAVIVSILK